MLVAKLQLGMVMIMASCLPSSYLEVASMQNVRTKVLTWSDRIKFLLRNNILKQDFDFSFKTQSCYRGNQKVLTEALLSVTHAALADDSSVPPLPVMFLSSLTRSCHC